MVWLFHVVLNSEFQVTTQCPEDIEAWIELGGILQNSDVTEALNAYNTAAQIIRDNIHEDVPPEILNNIASCLFQLGKYEVNVMSLSCYCVPIVEYNNSVFFCARLPWAQVLGCYR